MGPKPILENVLPASTELVEPHVMITRRSFFSGLISTFAAPAIVGFESLMPVKVPPLIMSSEDMLQEIVTVTRKAFLPKLVVQIYASTPLLACLQNGTLP